MQRLCGTHDGELIVRVDRQLRERGPKSLRPARARRLLLDPLRRHRRLMRGAVDMTCFQAKEQRMPAERLNPLAAKAYDFGRNALDAVQRLARARGIDGGKRLQIPLRSAESPQRKKTGT